MPRENPQQTGPLGALTQMALAPPPPYLGHPITPALTHMPRPFAPPSAPTPWPHRGAWVLKARMRDDVELMCWALTLGNVTWLWCERRAVRLRL